MDNRSGHKPGFDVAALRAQLAMQGQLPNDCFSQIDYFQSIGSTNAWLMAEPDIHARVCVADQQTAGRGRLGRVWLGGQARNLEFSLGWTMAAPLNPAISLVVGVAIARALAELGIRGIGLKWPNDVMLQGVKLGGVLVESRTSAGGGIGGVKNSEYVIGIGLNFSLSQTERDNISQQVADLSGYGYQLDREVVLAALLGTLQRCLDLFEVRGFVALSAEWQSYHIYHNEVMTFERNRQNLTGLVVGVNEQGALGLEVDGDVHYFHSGEIQIQKSARLE